jgi:hypothetical protein
LNPVKLAVTTTPIVNLVGNAEKGWMPFAPSNLLGLVAVQLLGEELRISVEETQIRVEEQLAQPAEEWCQMVEEQRVQREEEWCQMVVELSVKLMVVQPTVDRFIQMVAHAFLVQSVARRRPLAAMLLKHVKQTLDARLIYLSCSMPFVDLRQVLAMKMNGVMA